MPIKIIDPADMPPESMAACMRVADMAPIESLPAGDRAYVMSVRAKSTILQCPTCAHDIIRHESTPSHMFAICLPCAISIMEATKQ